MTIALRCRCGQVQGRIDPAGIHARATCYCRDCRAYARYLARPGLLDAAGGTDVVAMAPGALHIDAGVDQLACMSLGPRGLLRWYAGCCRTPLASMSRNARMYYASVPVACLDAPAQALDATLGPPGQIVFAPDSATAPVRATRLRLPGVVARIGLHALVARLRGRCVGAPFFDPDGRPSRAPEVPSMQQRAQLERDPDAAR